MNDPRNAELAALREPSRAWAQAVSDEGYPALLELLKFRHFRRYYFELEYDWDRIDFLLKKLDQAHGYALADLRRFKEFLAAL